MTRDINPAENTNNAPRSNVFKRLSQSAIAYWKSEDRVTLLEIQYIGIPMAAAVLTLGIGVVDDVADLHIAEHMAAVQVDPHENIVEQQLDRAIHYLGVQAVELESE